MKVKTHLNIFLIFYFIFHISVSYSKNYESNNQALEKRVNEISNNIRCLVCRNQSIYDSNSDFAKDIKIIISNYLKKGESEQFIYDFLESKYGDYILFKPPFQLNTLLLWMLPFLLIFGGLTYIAIKYIKYKEND